MNDAIHQTLVDCAEFLEGQRIPFAIIGGIAVSLRGESRFTADVDAVIGADVERTLSLIRELDKSAFRPLFSDVDEVVEKAFLLPLRHARTGIKVDLAIGLSGFERQVIERAMPIDVTLRPIPIATAEDIMLMKLLAARPQDVIDVQGIVSLHRNELDWEYLLRTGHALQEAVGVSLVAQVRELHRDP